MRTDLKKLNYLTDKEEKQNMSKRVKISGERLEELINQKCVYFHTFADLAEEERTNESNGFL